MSIKIADTRKQKKVGVKIGIFFLLSGLAFGGGYILGCHWCEPTVETTARTVPAVVTNTETPRMTTSVHEEATTAPHEQQDDHRDVEPVQFCGAADPDDATVLSFDAAMSYVALVNRCYRMAHDFRPNDLIVVNVPGVNFPPGETVHQLRQTAAHAAERLFEGASEAGLDLWMSSAFRDYTFQSTLFHNNVANFGLEETMRFSAVPGHSEHQLGLGVDLTTPALEGLGWLHGEFANTPEGIWVSQHAHRFGFIVSFPYGREADVAIIYEPWHIRYVGVDIATQMFNEGLILEEYLWYYGQ